MRVRVAAILCAVVLLAGVSLRAHDFWLASTSWTAIGDAWTVTAQVGERFPEPQTALTADRVDLWRVLGSQGDMAVSRDFRVEKTRTSVDVKLPQPGAYLGVMTVVARTIEMTGKEFTEYLNEEGLDAVIAARRTSGDAERPAKERYARYAKIAVRTGSGSAAHMTRPVGLKAEFVPASDPTLLRPGDSLIVQLLIDGKPVSGAAVTGVNSAGGDAVRGRTDNAGRVGLRLDRGGAWLIKTVHMTKLPAGSSEDWESFWVTLSLHTTAP